SPRSHRRARGQAPLAGGSLIPLYSRGRPSHVLRARHLRPLSAGGILRLPHLSRRQTSPPSRAGARPVRDPHQPPNRPGARPYGAVLASSARRRGDRMRRREFIAGLGGAAAWPLVARAQVAGKVWRIGVLGGAPRPILAENYSGFQQGMRELGYFEGRDFVNEL